MNFKHKLFLSVRLLDNLTQTIKNYLVATENTSTVLTNFNIACFS